MIEDKEIVEFLNKVKLLTSGQVIDVMTLICDCWRSKGNSQETAKTILEIVEPERIGEIVWDDKDSA